MYGSKSGIPEACVQPQGHGGELDESRFPPVRVTPDRWCKPQPPARPQFDDVLPQSGLKADAPFTYSGANLAAVQFPIGGFGGGNVILGGDGTLQGWTVVNQVRAESLPMHDIPACFFGITADDQSFLLASPETYTEENCALPPGKPARVSPASVRRLQALPGVKSMTLTGKFPVADVEYEIDGFPLQVAMEATSHSGRWASGNSFSVRVAVSMSNEMALMGGWGRSGSPAASSGAPPGW